MNFILKRLPNAFPVLLTRRLMEESSLKSIRVDKLADLTRSTSYQSKFGTVVTEVPSPLLLHTSPVVVILGWNNSQEKYLKKYSEIFEAKNFDSICVPAKTFDTFFRSGTKVKQISMHILDLLLELNCQKRPVFLYAFSNGGCAMFCHMMEALSYPSQQFYRAVPVVGTIFDSCPINPDINSLKATLESVTDTVKNPVLKSVAWCALRVCIPPVIYFNSSVKRYMSALRESPLQCPQLLLYSKADKYAPYQDIESYAQARKDKGVSIIAKCWESSDHVNHYREHAIEYVDVVNSFVDQCLATYHEDKE